MCEWCEELQKMTLRCREFLRRRFDPLTESRMKKLIADLQRQKDTMH
jgi:hypothetical protein